MHGTLRAQESREELHWGGHSNEGNVLSHAWKTKGDANAEQTTKGMAQFGFLQPLFLPLYALLPQ